MSFARSLTLLPALTLLFSLSAVRAQEGKQAQTPPLDHPPTQQLPPACKASFAEMSAFLQAEANETPTGEVARTPIFNLTVFANQGEGKTAAPRQDMRGSWTLVGEILPDKGLKFTQGTMPKGAVCILNGENSGYPDKVRKQDWYQAEHFSLIPPTLAPAPKQ
jgi:hypothetical protein